MTHKCWQNSTVTNPDSRLEFLGNLEDGSCDIRILNAQSYKDQGQWKCLTTSDAHYQDHWFSDTVYVEVETSGLGSKSNHSKTILDSVILKTF